MKHLGKFEVLGTLVDAVDYAAAEDAIINAAAERRPLAATALAVHGLIEAVDDPTLQARLNELDLVTPDGQPVRWALNWLHGADLTDRVYGPRLMHLLLHRAERDRIAVYFYGSTESVCRRLTDTVCARHPALVVAGSEPSLFRELTDREDHELASRICGAGAQLVFIGLGCPRQEAFVHRMRNLIGVPLVAVGAAFDYHAGELPVPHRWIQRIGLEWAWRLLLEPRRLWRRYLVGNPRFMIGIAKQRLTRQGRD